MDFIITGLLLGGAYALIAVGLQLQYGVARIMNLANGEMLVAGAFGAFWVFTAHQLSPFLSVLVTVPIAFALNWAIYRYLMQPLVKRARNHGQLEVDSILSTFGLAFIFVGVMVAMFGGEYFTYEFLARPFRILGEPYALNRVVAFAFSVVVCICLYVWLNRTRAGLTIRAVAVNPASAQLVGIDVPRVSAFAFAMGGALAAAGGASLSTFLTFDAFVGVIFTLKALVIVIMGGVTDMRGAILTAFILGLAETFVATYVDPGLTLAAAYVLFMLVLLFRPQGIFGQRTS
jgi:branched-chain amino acid transport system permease protein